MKNIFTLFLVFISSFVLIAQDFAPIGAEWYFAYESPFSFVETVSYRKFIATKDTSFMSKPCRLINSNILVYSSNDTVYFYDNMFNEFQVLYVFNAQVNDFWHIKVMDETNDIDTVVVTVDSLSTMSINGFSLKVMNVTYSKIAEHQEFPHSSKIVEKIGDLHQFFNWRSETDNFVSDVGYFTGIRCYEDLIIGYYQKNSSIACDYIYFTDINDQQEKEGFTIFPNPVKNTLFINNISYKTYRYSILNQNGVTVLSQQSDSQSFNVSNLPKGVYTLLIEEMSKKILQIKKIIIF